MDVQQNRAGATAPAPQTASVRRSSDTNSTKNLVTILFGVLLAMLILGGLYKAFNTLMADRAVKGGQYQAVFLTNNQVYFGKLTQTASDNIKLTDIYYLQVQQAVQPDSSKSTSTTAQQQQISLAKLGSELHGPEDVMYVSRTQVLFWENLKKDGKVAQAIADYQKSQKK